MKFSFSTLTSGMRYLSMLPLSFLSKTGDGHTPASPYGPSWDKENTDILERSEWLSKKILAGPDAILASMPKELGPNYGGQWAIYSCCMYAFALANISRLYPEQKQSSLGRIEKLIEIVKDPKLRRYDTMSWHEDALSGLKGSKSHLSYYSLLAWMISEYKLAGGEKCAFDSLYEDCCEALNRRMVKSVDYNIPTFANGIIFIPDMIPALIALNNYSKLYDDRYVDTVEHWKRCIRKNWVHRSTGLILSKSGRGKSCNPRGSYAGLICSYLSLLDENMAREQYEALKKHLVITRNVLGKKMTGVREYLDTLPEFSFNPDAGPIFQGLSASGTAFVIGAATRLGDWELRRSFLSAAEIAGNTQYGDGERHYRLAELALVGEAVTLAMRTNI